MTHPLTDEMVLELVKHVSETTDWNNCDKYPSTLYARAAADWQLEQVIEWVKHCRGYRLELASETWNFVQDLKAAMRPKQQEDN